MTTFKFKTSLSCSGCVSKIKKLMDEEKAITSWEVDLNSPDKLLSIQTETLDPSFIPPLLLKAGYKASLV